VIKQVCHHSPSRKLSAFGKVIIPPKWERLKLTSLTCYTIILVSKRICRQINTANDSPQTVKPSPDTAGGMDILVSLKVTI
jgi:hypothetical protein